MVTENAITNRKVYSQTTLDSNKKREKTDQKRIQTTQETSWGGFLPKDYDHTEILGQNNIKEDSDSDTIQELGVPPVNWTKYAGCKSIPHIEKKHALIVNLQDVQEWNLETTVREVEQNFSTDLELIVKERTNDEVLSKTLECLKRQQLKETPEDYRIVNNKLSIRIGTVSLEDYIVLPRGLRMARNTLLHK